MAEVYRGIKPFEYALPPDDEECYLLVCVRRSFIPFLAGAVRRLEFRGVWADNDSWDAGQHAALEFQEALMGCITLQHLEDMNVLLAHATGLTDGANPDQIATFMPALGARLKAIRDEALDTTGLLETEVARYPAAGTIPTGWLWQERKVTLSDVLQALRVGNDQTKEDLWDKFYEILLASSSGANLTDLLADFFTDSVSAGLEGGILTMLVATMMGNIVAQTNTEAKLDRIIHALDGGGLLGANDSILEALRGNTDASAERNLADLLISIRAKLIEADPDDDSLLEEIRKLLV